MAAPEAAKEDNQFCYCTDKSARFYARHHNYQLLLSDKLQHYQLLTNVGINSVWLLKGRAVAGRPKMEQLTGFSRLVSAHSRCCRVRTVHLHWRTEDNEEAKMYGVFGCWKPPYPVPPRKITLAYIRPSYPCVSSGLQELKHNIGSLKESSI